ncbi:MAG: hypothetical protein FJ134_02390 [Deltaproteobacteria bacterium]|nr:hypothetical protein [Deltaproteobacteria bacterium]
MKEAEVRKFHRRLGIILVGFLAVQALTGLVLSVAGLAGYTSWLTKTAGVIHYNWDPLGTLYRVLLTAATAIQGISGIIIYQRIKERQKKPGG